MILYIVLFLSAVFISSVSQILLKKSANNSGSFTIKDYLNFKVIFAYFLFFSSTLLTLYSYKVVPLSMGAVLEASGYIWVTILGRIFLREKVAPKKLIGLIIIVTGVIVFSL